MDRLELIVCLDRELKEEESEELQGLLDNLGIDYASAIIPEDSLQDETNFAQDAVVYVHGNAEWGFNRVGFARALAEKRPDLKFIIGIAAEATEEWFGDKEDYRFVKQCIQAGFNASHQVVVQTETFFSFVIGLNYRLTAPIENSLSNYLQQLFGTEQETQHIFIYHHRLCREKPDPITKHQIELCTDSAAEAMDGKNYQLDFRVEDDLKTHDNIPQDSVVCVHGDAQRGYVTAGWIREITKERSDLKFIICVDPEFREDKFANKEDYKFVKQALLHGFDPSQQVIVSTATVWDFFRGRDGLFQPTERSFKNYMRQLNEHPAG